MVMIIIGIAAVAVLLILVFTLALAASARSGDSRIWEEGPLSILGTIRSPSGRPFFASRNAVHDFVATMEDLGRDLSSGRSETRAAPTAKEPVGAAAEAPAGAPAEAQDDAPRSA